jgi:membrane protein DedA with SNARE-associated domain
MLTVVLQEEVAPLAGGAAAHHGHGSLLLVIAACAAGSCGRLTRRARLGRPLRFIARHPLAAPLVMRFSIGARFTLAIACGAAGLPVGRFALWDGVSAALWSTVYGLLGWGAGELAERLFADLRHHEIVAVAGVTVMWLAVFALLHLRGGGPEADAA